MPVNQLKAGAVLSYIVLILNSLVGLLYTPYMLRMMGQSEYGLYSLVASIIAYLTILDLGFGNAIIRYTAKFRAEGKTDEQYSMFGMFLVLYSIISVIALLIGAILYFNIDSLFGRSFTDQELAKVRIIMVLMLFNLAVTFPLSIFGSIITAYEDFIFQKIVQIVRILLNTAVMIILLKIGYRAIGMVVVITFFNLSTLLLNLWYCRYRVKIKIKFNNFNWLFLKEVAIYSFYIFLNIIMDRIYWSTGQFVLGMYIGTAAVAVFAVAIQLQQMYMGFSSAIAGVFLPKVTAMTASGESKTAISDLFIKTGRIQYIVLSFILSGFILFGKQFIVFWAGPDYSEAYIMAVLFFVSLTIPLIQNLGITILQARNQMRFRSLIYIVIAFASLGLQIILSKRYGGIGCAIGTSAALIIGQVVIMNIYYYKKQSINIPKFWFEIGKMSISPAILGIITYIILGKCAINTIPKLGIAIVLFSIVYVAVIWFTGLNNYERELIRGPVKRVFNKIAAL